MKRFLAMILCVSMAVALVGAQAETAERTEGEQAALEILSRQMTTSATSLIQWGEDVKNLYPELEVQQPSFSDHFPATAGGSAAICPDCGYVLTEAGR